MSARQWPLRSRVPRGILVAALLIALTFGGAPLSASCCCLGGSCRCGGDKTPQSVNATTPLSQKACPCCASHKGCCRPCCLHRQATTSAAKSGRNVVSISALWPSPFAAASCCTEVPLRDKRSSSERCHCMHRADREVPRHVNPVRIPITERVVENVGDRVPLDQVAAVPCGRCQILATDSSSHAERFIALCCLVI
jgi:hypothetical protein